MLDNGGGFAEIAGTRAATYHRNATDGRDSATITRMVQLSNGDIVKMQGQSDRVTQLTTVANACRLMFERI